MLELMPESGDAVLAFRACGVLTKDDYQDVLVPQLETALEAVDRIRVLVLMDETFRGWDARAAWINTCLDLRHRRDFEKVAIVGAPTWEEWCVKLANVLIAGELKTFKREQLSKAWTWLRG
ncbi:MAG TPA: STAS/SEC14 domain-containing protein [Pseudonocardiaceae bacterium]|nr:STAS/SEC14 domain-containing protein [Pseudonocardiaceae bacterium]